MKFTYLDFPGERQYGFQDPASPIMEGIIDLHDHIFFYLIVIGFLVLWLFLQIIIKYGINLFNPKNIKDLQKRYWYFLITQNLSHGTLIEIVWTLTPSIILMFIAIPSFALLYSMDEIIDPTITIKAIGHQWYWSYEYSDYNSRYSDLKSLKYNSYELFYKNKEDFKKFNLFNWIKVLETNLAIILPVNTQVRVIVTSADVLHSWAVPALGVKVDAVPGRLNQTSLFIKREGIYYGQCSELCGTYHSVMPITIKAISLKDYVNLIENKIKFLNFAKY